MSDVRNPTGTFIIFSILAGVLIVIGLTSVIIEHLLYGGIKLFNLVGLLFISAGFISFINSTYNFVKSLNSDTYLLLSRENHKLQKQIDEIWQYVRKR